MTKEKYIRSLGKEQFTKFVNNSQTLTNIVDKLSFTRTSSSNVVIKKMIKEWDINTDHLRGKAFYGRPLVKFEDLKGDGSRKARMLKEQTWQCQVCKRKTWMGKKIPIEIDHIDGNCLNNIRSNLRLICPNCHAQTDTYKGKNIGNVRGKRKAKYTKFPIQKYRFG